MPSAYSKKVPAARHPRETQTRFPTISREVGTMATPSLTDRQLQRGFITKEWTNSGQSVPRSCDEPGKDLRRKPKDVENRNSKMKGCQTTDEQSFAVNEPVSFWQITVNGGRIEHYSKSKKLCTDAAKAGTTDFTPGSWGSLQTAAAEHKSEKQQPEKSWGSTTVLQELFRSCNPSHRTPKWLPRSQGKS